MRSLNKVFLMGRLGQSPRLESSIQGKPYTRLSVATHRSRKDADNNWVEETDWHSVNVWGRDAEVCAESLEKGSLVLVEGDLRAYIVGSEDARQTKWSVQAHRITFLNRKIPSRMATVESELPAD